MEKFEEQLENLKTCFSKLPEDLLLEAIEKLDQVVERLSQSVVFVDAQDEYLADMGKEFVKDFLNPSDPSFFEPSTSTSDFFYTDIPSTTPTPLFCFTCGEGFNNRKGLYRHGNATGHQTREFRRRKKKVSEEEEPSFEIYEPFEQEIQEPQENPEPRQLICYQCNSPFKNRKALWRHGQKTRHRLRLKRALVFKGGPVKCPECEFSTDKAANMRMHYKRNHCM
uniref:C2H2-type domain-containing protein n=1 Tax=Caenorhabditis tropicalis TaxID=1561998 RepID=A0A1I7T693_9PELO